ncbi:sigma-70 family RNA polymerase sigma factor [Pseudokineococcus basanitobsidens]|uniref:RNA polymerase sigma factor n=1 Tax=Pseudokineococcus basanitobsidens TaxID=1926649 RepID=A0ABU8RMZ0_9ACTN
MDAQARLRSGDHTGDAYLVTRAREGYRGAFEHLVRRHQNRAYTLAVRMVGDRHEAQDVVQDAFVQAWLALPGFDERAAFGTWLHRIVVNACLTHLRRRRPVPVPQDPGLPSPVTTARVVEERMRDDVLHRSIQQLPIDQRAALVLTAFAGCTYAEAADLLGTTPATVRGRTARARRALLTRMEGWA